MGTNVIYLDELATAASVPAYRRVRGRAVPPANANGTGTVCAPSPASWVAGAQRRAALRLAAVPVNARAASSVRVAPALTAQPVDQTTAPAAPRRVGALRLAGRLVDVCAELERLAQAEALADAMARRA